MPPLKVGRRRGIPSSCTSTAPKGAGLVFNPALQPRPGHTSRPASPRTEIIFFQPGVPLSANLPAALTLVSSEPSRALPSPAEPCRALPSPAEPCRALPSPAEPSPAGHAQRNTHQCAPSRFLFGPGPGVRPPLPSVKFITYHAASTVTYLSFHNGNRWGENRAGAGGLRGGERSRGCMERC